ncbi:MAG: hypothetical protein ACYDCO_26105 [Armatimonadota bacterium]
MKTRLLYLALLLFLLPFTVWAQDETAVADTETVTDATTTDTAPAPRASLLPDISVIGNGIGVLSDNAENEDRDRLRLQEVEVVIGSPIYPGIRGDLVVALHDPDFNAEVEEGYLTVERLLQAAPIGGRLGIVRLPFGKTNPAHPHQLPYADTPAVIANLLGDEFIGNGFEVIGLAPLGGRTFLQGQIGRWEPREAHGHEEEEGEESQAEAGAGFSGEERLTLGRLWAGTEIGPDSELEFGMSGAFGQGRHEEDDGEGGIVIERSDITLLGADVTWRKWLPGERRLLLQGEAIRREEKGEEGTVRQLGYFLLGTYRPNHVYEFGTRYDWSETPAAAGAHASSISAFATRFLNETTFTRLQLKHGTNPHGENENQVLFQVVFGFGPHAHVLQ